MKAKATVRVEVGGMASEIVSSLLPDCKEVSVRQLNEVVEFKVRDKKISHLKGIINTYLGLIKLLAEVNEVV